MMRHGSLFSGIGGFDLAAEWMQWFNIFNCEKDSFCRQVLTYYWPEAENYEDIFEFDAAQYRGCVDIITGGFPCQPFSQAGRRKGKTDDRYLWPETRRVIMEARPKWIVLENVAGLFTILEPESLSQMEIETIELFCSNSKQEANKTIIKLQRRVIGSIISEIESAGYVLPRLEDGTPVVLCIPAASVNAPHRRDRVWFVAYSKHHTDWQDFDRQSDPGSERKDNEGRIDHDSGIQRPDSHSYGNGRDGRDIKNEIFASQTRQHAQHDAGKIDRDASYSGSERLEGKDSKRTGKPAWSREIPHWNGWPAQPAICGGDDGLSRRLDAITFPKWRMESVKGYGNAIVPQVALELFKAIESVEKQSGH
ncbi:MULTISPECIES: DNA cytosine methyltransferase [unclassified Flavobacterium]|uniref:DNA cytosine methyltransferase n=1 Tax=unclassified Flavobacterium TaxID=196869 RepID=UPI00086EEA45|nr:MULTISPECIES: DNA cytosine methyltransferase [unclassified Flavobacterium]MBN9284132.1 DNA cytosine methyltransferase [Flavobacterium sp.]ODS83600.1 MAG: hypothetical protein ABS44_17245 [Chryseobacterium sp. SCN 40-13]OJV71146.1 MAG: hypothetical protein BGO42_04860 [Flavobacterium sp. 40-81]